MHEYPDLASRCAHFTLSNLKNVEDKVIEELQISGATRLVKALQMIRLQKAVTACGMFSLFEANLQSFLDCGDGFKAANKSLELRGHTGLAEEFLDFQRAINVLKHGRGSSYDALVAKADKLSFKVKTVDNVAEGDVSEISTLIDVDDAFVLRCAEIIEYVFMLLRKEKYGY